MIIETPSTTDIDRVSPTRRPSGSAVMYQKWRNLLFLHWTFPPEVLRPLLPKGLELDTFEGKAYVGLVPFYMTDVRPAYVPALPWISHFPETNIRTYVHQNGQNPGVWFMSLEAANPIAVVLARTLFCLPYFRARMKVERDSAADRIRYTSTRFWPEPVPASTRIECRPQGEPRPAVVGTLDHFLIERYLLYAKQRNRLYSGQVHHLPYLVQPAELHALDETLLAANGLLRPGTAPLIHYAGGVDVEIFSLQFVAGS